MYVVVFFFKQKTAYEMRNSDWSSDVCSSDLEPLPQRADPERSGRWSREDRAEAQHDQNNERREYRKQRKESDDAALGPAGEPLVMQIGRASGRERECQYV